MGEETRKTKLRATPPHRHYDYRVFRVQKSEAHGGGRGEHPWTVTAQQQIHQSCSRLLWVGIAHLQKLWGSSRRCEDFFRPLSQRDGDVGLPVASPFSQFPSKA